MSPIMMLHEEDPLGVALEELVPGPVPECTVVETIPKGHKVAVREIAEGELVRKFGQVIGEATAPISPGEWVHTHNLAAIPRPGETEIGTEVIDAPSAPERTFDGFLRSDGRVGTRNYVGILTSVNCSATVARMLAQRAERELLPSYPGVDGVVALTHNSGCGHPAEGRVLAHAATHARRLRPSPELWRSGPDRSRL